MYILELQRASMGPHLWIAKSSSKERNSDGALPHLVTRHLVMSDPSIADVFGFHIHYLVPGGRYLFSISCEWLILWDLGPPYSSSREARSVAAVPAKFCFYLVHSTPDGMGFRVFLHDTADDYASENILYIYEIYPESTSPQLTQIAYTHIPRSDSPNIFSLSYDCLIFTHENILTVWDYKANLWARWGIEGKYIQILTTKSTVTLIRPYGVSVWEIPPLLPESSLSMNTDPSIISPLFELHYPENHHYPYLHQVPCDWYSGTPQSLYYDVMDDTPDPDSDSPIKINRFEVVINPKTSGGTLNLLKTFEVPSIEGHDLPSARICYDKNFSIYAASGTNCLKTHVTDIHDQQLPSFSTPLYDHYIRGPLADVTFCPATGRVVYRDTDQSSSSIIVLDYLAVQEFFEL